MPILRTALSTFRHFALLSPGPIRSPSQPIIARPLQAHLNTNTNTNHIHIHNHIWKRAMSSAVAKRLSGKTIVITGASSGIGRSTAFEFARTAPQNELKLVLTARRIDALRQIADDIAAETNGGVKVLPVKLDVSNPDEVRGFLASLPEEFREIDVLVNNA